MKICNKNIFMFFVLISLDKEEYSVCLLLFLKWALKNTDIIVEFEEKFIKKLYVF